MRADLAARGTSVQTHPVDAHHHPQLRTLFADLPYFAPLISMGGDVLGGSLLCVNVAQIRQVIESKFFTNVCISQLVAGKVRKGGSLTSASGSGGHAQDAFGSDVGINALAEGLAVERAPDVRVNAVSPSWTVTLFWHDLPTEPVETTRQHFTPTIPLRR